LVGFLRADVRWWEARGYLHLPLPSVTAKEIGDNMQQTAFTEDHATTIEPANRKAARITRQLQEFDPPRPSEEQVVGKTAGPKNAPSSFRRRVTAARTSLEG
jgi:hypothetical protein